MFSKPIMIAASVAATNATLMKVGGSTLPAAKSDETGCGLCLSYTDTQTAATGGYIMGNDATSATSKHYTTLAAFVKTEVDTDTIKGDACCKDTSSTEKGGTSAFCAKAATAYSATAKHSNIVLAANDFFQSALAKCPHNTTNCTYAGVKGDTAKTAITVTAANQRFISIEDQGSVALRVRRRDAQEMA